MDAQVRADELDQLETDNIELLLRLTEQFRRLNGLNEYINGVIRQRQERTAEDQAVERLLADDPQQLLRQMEVENQRLAAEHQTFEQRLERSPFPPLKCVW